MPLNVTSTCPYPDSTVPSGPVLVLIPTELVGKLPLARRRARTGSIQQRSSLQDSAPACASTRRRTEQYARRIANSALFLRVTPPELSTSTKHPDSAITLYADTYAARLYHRADGESISPVAPRIFLEFTVVWIFLIELLSVFKAKIFENHCVLLNDF